MNMYYSKESYEEVINDANTPKTDIYMHGFNYDGDDPHSEFHKYYKITKDMGCPLWGDFYRGHLAKQDIKAHLKFHELKLDEFSNELLLLLQKYDVQVSFGCGCCGGGMECGDLEFSLPFKYLNCAGGDE